MIERFSTEEGITDANGVAIPWPTVFDEFGSDKGNHGYAPFYTHLEPPQRMLEIGVQHGYSLLAWRKLWPDSFIFGVDRTMNAVAEEVRCLKGVALIEADYRDAMIGASRYFNGSLNLNLIVDDGSHLPTEQIDAYRRMSGYLAPAGVYVIEDVADPSIADELGGELIRTGPGYDDRLLVLR